MSRRPSLYTRKALGRWSDEVTAASPDLTKPQAAGLAGWSFGMVLARCCALFLLFFDHFGLSAGCSNRFGQGRRFLLFRQRDRHGLFGLMAADVHLVGRDCESL